MPLVTITIEQHDIDNGMRGWCGRCPVARAANRVVVAGYSTHVTTSRLSLKDSDGLVMCGHTFHLPYEARQFIRDFDQEEPVAPFQFQLDIPAEFLRTTCQT